MSVRMCIYFSTFVSACACTKDEASNTRHVVTSTPKITIFRRSNATIFPYVITCLAYHTMPYHAMPSAFSLKSRQY